MSNNKIQIIKKEQKDVAEYLKKNYINPYLEDKLKKYNFNPKKDLNTDKIIWQYWGQGINDKTPLVVQACLKSVDSFKGDYERIMLTDDTIPEYIDVPIFVKDKLENNKEFTLTFFSDLLRLALLSAYGGIWADATIFLSNNIEPEILNKDLFFFQRGERPINWKESFYFGWDDDFKVKMLNSFIIAKKNNLLLNSCLDILLNYWEKEEHFIHYFLFQILFNELINMKEFKYLNCAICDDTKPHVLQWNMYKKYSKNLWNASIKDASIHKLTYKLKEKDIHSTILEHVLLLYFPKIKVINEEIHLALNLFMKYIKQILRRFLSTKNITIDNKKYKYLYFLGLKIKLKYKALPETLARANSNMHNSKREV